MILALCSAILSDISSQSTFFCISLEVFKKLCLPSRSLFVFIIRVALYLLELVISDVLLQFNTT